MQSSVVAITVLQLVTTIVNPILVLFLLRNEPAKAFANGLMTGVVGLLTQFSVQCLMSGQCFKLAAFYTFLSLSTTAILVYALRTGSTVDISQRFQQWTGGAVESKEVRTDNGQ